MNYSLRLFSKFISIIFHPLLMPSYIYAVLLYFSHGLIGGFNYEQKLSFIGLTFVTTFLLPFLIVVLYLIASEQPLNFTTLTMNNNAQRVRPFLLVSTVYAFLSYYILTHWYSQLVIAIVLASIAVAILCSAIISKFWKISIHAVGLGGTSGFFFLFYFHYFQSNLYYFWVISFLIAGLVLSARIYLKAHTHKQAYVGWLMGFILCYSSIYFL